MQTIIRFSALAALLATAGCVTTTAPAPTPAYVAPTVTTVPAGTTVIVPHP